MQILFLLYGVTTCLFSLTYAAAPCFYVDGTPATDHQPCFPNQSISACCVLSNGVDICTNKGLCQNDSGMMYQGGCTDSTYMSGNCSQFCPGPYNNWAGGDTYPFWNVLMCTKNTYCCRPPGSTSDCCSNLTNLKSKVPGLPVIAQTATVTLQSATCSSGSSNYHSSSANPTADTAKSPFSNNTQQCTTSIADNNKKVVAIGAGVGVPLATLLAVTIALLIMTKKSQQKLRRELDTLHADLHHDPAAGRHMLDSTALSSNYKTPVEVLSREMAEMEGANFSPAVLQR